MDTIIENQSQERNDHERVIAVVIPCYNVKEYILGVLKKIGPEVTQIICIDDKCPQNSGDYIQNNCMDDRVSVLYNQFNLGVGGATMKGYSEAIRSGADIVVKIDGDGQMDPALIKRFIMPIISARADYTKGNRFYRLESLKRMPIPRIIGNAALSFITKLSTGYWNIFDPTNGFTAIHSRIIRELPLKNISNRYFFESDILFRLNIIGAVVEEVPMDSVYGNEKSNMKIAGLILEFLYKHIRNYFKRIAYNYFLRNFGVASLELVLGNVLFLFGLIFGSIKWSESLSTGVPVSAGTVMLAGLPVIVGLQMLLSFVNYDVNNIPNNPLHKRLY